MRPVMFQIQTCLLLHNRRQMHMYARVHAYVHAPTMPMPTSMLFNVTGLVYAHAHAHAHDMHISTIAKHRLVHLQKHSGVCIQLPACAYMGSPIPRHTRVHMHVRCAQVHAHDGHPQCQRHPQERVNWRRKKQQQNEMEHAVLQHLDEETTEQYLWRRLNTSSDNSRLYQVDNDVEEEELVLSTLL